MRRLEGSSAVWNIGSDFRGADMNKLRNVINQGRRMIRGSENINLKIGFCSTSIKEDSSKAEESRTMNKTKENPVRAKTPIGKLLINADMLFVVESIK